MDTSKSTSVLAAAQRALANQQILALRDWLGEDHDLLRQRVSPQPTHAPLRVPVAVQGAHTELKAAA